MTAPNRNPGDAMPVMLQMRRWFKSAPPGQVAGVVVGLVLALALFGTSLSSGSDTLSTNTASTQNNSGGLGTPAGGPAGTTGGGSTGTGGSSGAARTTSGGSAAGSGGVTSLGGGAGTTGGTTSGGGTTAGGGTSSGIAGGGTTGGGGTTRFASDRGVTPTTVKLGFLYLNFGSVAGASQAVGLRSDIDKVIQAYVADANRHGGLAGRKIQAVLRSTDILDENDQNAACVSMVDDQKVFAISSTAISAQTATDCITLKGKTPMVNVLSTSDADQTKVSGYDITLIRSIDRIYSEWAASLTQIGFLKAGDKVGIVADNCDPNLGVVNKVLVPAVKKAGAGQVLLKVHDCAINNAQQQMPGIVSYFASNGVTKIMPADCPYAIIPFLSQAKAINYHPKYTISDYCNGSADALAQLFDPDEFGGTLGITGTYAGGFGVHAALTPPMIRCSKILVAAGLPGLDYSSKNSEAVAQCDYLTLLVQAINKAGPNPTRPGLAQTFGSIGDFQAGFSASNIYKPGKYSGGDLIHTIRFDGNCKCYVSTTGLRRGKY
jgi:ABC-type branched-subunit amino acid transport system substrate-binding protein